MSDYAEKLKDPRWQKKRLEVFEDSEFTCEDCGAKDKTLHVHHLLYEFRKDPWEYGLESLMCLCDDCHTERGPMEKALVKQFKLSLRYFGTGDMRNLENSLAQADGSAA